MRISDWGSDVCSSDLFAGTSNVRLAMKHGVTPLGTMGNEYLQACQPLGPRLRDSQVYALEVWAQEYRGDLGIALYDVYGMDAFLRDRSDSRVAGKRSAIRCRSRWWRVE